MQSIDLSEQSVHLHIPMEKLYSASACHDTVTVFCLSCAQICLLNFVDTVFLRYSCDFVGQLDVCFKSRCEYNIMVKSSKSEV